MVTCLFLAFLPFLHGFNVLQIGIGLSNSHIMFNYRIAQTLTGHGHNVTLLMVNKIPSWIRQCPNVHHIEQPVSKDIIPQMNVIQHIAFQKTDYVAMIRSQRLINRFVIERCLAVLNDPDHKHYITQIRYDVVIGESFDLCIHALYSATSSHKFIAVVAGAYVLPFTSLATGVPDNPSFIPQMMTTYSDQMSFVARLINFAIGSIGKLFLRISLFKYEWKIVRDFSSCVDDACSSFLKRTSALMLNGNGPMDFPRPLVPQMFYMSDLEIKREVVLSKVRCSCCMSFQITFPKKLLHYTLPMLRTFSNKIAGNRLFNIGSLVALFAFECLQFEQRTKNPLSAENIFGCYNAILPFIIMLEVISRKFVTTYL
ncbi:unnamed protein product [Soboliphyme baturini]|uniref:glucuronosyltransferase n=1 Tax=Soboliphyme baturini TaxID=241478 RepID=A0A183IW46_9BILA|nr:unnamed protein product [Soboliphyme baturini]